LFAFASAFATNVGFLLRQRGAVEAPDVDVRRPVHTTIELFNRKWWSIGFAVAAVAWALQVAALKFAPISLVQAVLASGFVILGVLAERFFGFRLEKRQWIGIGLTTLGLALLAVTAASTKTTGSHSKYALAGALAFEAALVAGGALMVASHQIGFGRGKRASWMAAGAGMLFTVSHIGIKALSGSIDFGRPATLLSPWVPIVVAAFVGAFFASARSLQIGDGVGVIAVTSAVSNVSAILGGIVVFSDPVGANPLMVAIRIIAFALVCLAAALIPAPVRLGEAQATGAPGEGRSERPREAALGQAA
jgi:drug/metabolite transporter (DMT)-like permease